MLCSKVLCTWPWPKCAPPPFRKNSRQREQNAPGSGNPAQEARGGQEAGGRTGADGGFRGTEQPSPRVGPWESALHYPAAQRQREAARPGKAAWTSCPDLVPRASQKLWSLSLNVPGGFLPQLPGGMRTQSLTFGLA